MELSRVVTIRLPAEVVVKIEDALKSPGNDCESIGDYCRKAVIRHAFRHVPGGYRGRMEYRR